MAECAACDRASLEAQVRALKDLLEVASAVVSTLDLDTVMRAILTSAMRFAETPAGSVALFETKSQKLTLQAHAGMSAAFAQKERGVVIPGGVTECVLKSGEMVLVEDTAQSSFVWSAEDFPERIRSLICVPLKVQGSIVGLLYLDDFVPRRFDREKMNLISVLVSFSSVAIYNATLHNRTKLMAITDALTGLHNHRYFHQVFNQELGRAKRYQKPLAILFMDVDNFKQFNDAHGHANGDRALALIGEIVSRTLRRIDFAFRYGGEEFAVLLPETRLESALQVAERLRERIEHDTREMIKGVSHGITVSIGVACYPEDGTTREQLFARVDELLYRAKEGGKNMVHFFRASTPIGCGEGS